MSTVSFQNFDRVSAAIGGGPALRLFSFYSALTDKCYVPEQATEGHILGRLLGRRAFIDLVANFRGESLPVSHLHTEPIKLAAKVWSLDNKNISRQNIAGLLGVTPARVGQILGQLKADGFGDLDDAILTGGADHV